MHFKMTTPCNNCPYRKDAPRAHWHKAEFEKLLGSEQEQFGRVYQCHKKNGNICVGYLMNQDDHHFPNLNLRLVLIKNNITRAFLDSLHCSSERFHNVQEMVDAQNFDDE